MSVFVIFFTRSMVLPTKHTRVTEPSENQQSTNKSGERGISTQMRWGLLKQPDNQKATSSCWCQLDGSPGGGRELRPLGKRERRPHISALVQAIQCRPKAKASVL